MAKELFEIVDQTNAEQYKWGEDCSAWHFLKDESLSIIKESMPPNTIEKLHYHEKAQQFFYILAGIASFQIGNKQIEVGMNQGLSIQLNVKHRISNKGNQNLDFLVISQPMAHGDRININNSK